MYIYIYIYSTSVWCRKEDPFWCKYLSMPMFPVAAARRIGVHLCELLDSSSIVGNNLSSDSALMASRFSSIIAC